MVYLEITNKWRQCQLKYTGLKLMFWTDIFRDIYMQNSIKKLAVDQCNLSTSWWNDETGQTKFRTVLGGGGLLCVETQDSVFSLQ